jgi:hypothetical protein
MTNYFKPNFFQKLANTIAAFAALPFAFSTVIASFIDLSSREKLFEYLFLKDSTLGNAWKVLIPFILFYALVWHIIDQQDRIKLKPFPSDKIWYFGILLSRYSLAIVLSGYGFAKLLGTQFSPPYLMYGTELGDLDGNQITVAFFAYSSIYGNTIGVLQIVCSIALLFHRTARLAFFILLPILANILFIDFTFDGWEGPRVIISTLMYISLFNLFCDYKEIKAFFLAPQGILPGNKSVPSIIGGKLRLPLKMVVIVGIIFFSFNDLYRFKKAVTYAPGYSAVIDGAWYSEKVELYNDSLYRFQDINSKIGFFVGDQAAVLKRLGENTWYNLKLDSTNNKNIEMTTENDSLQLKLITGQYRLIDKDNLQITGKEGNDSIRWLFKRRN